MTLYIELSLVKQYFFNLNNCYYNHTLLLLNYSFGFTWFPLESLVFKMYFQIEFIIQNNLYFQLVTSQEWKDSLRQGGNQEVTTLTAMMTQGHITLLPTREYRYRKIEKISKWEVNFTLINLRFSFQYWW